jgi:hypothetical protein
MAKVFVLSVNGGEVESHLGVYRSMESVMKMITEERDGGGFTQDNGYDTVSPAREPEDAATVTLVYVYEQGREFYDWSLLFTIRECEVQD